MSPQNLAVQTPVTPLTAISTPTSRGQFARFKPPSCLLNLSGDFQSDEEEFEFFRVRNRYSFDTSSDTDSSRHEVLVSGYTCTRRSHHNGIY